ncbi:hypothetical protein [Sulfobacillus thermosulfidooxidans]|uniref:hypothetical protein n=1 Tax=Sulfobacillus thermosulfidooxidans TaxID=28034 RepID=UPI00096B9370|nr:hypothetical protein [Sulfobacillus thermosulfidooxidans]OLZ11995.1 hypothetical protein BFX05_05855 [Sulfobacillus thermosulfidooxidans]OLZ16753.1 hypothetical protein BFX06_14740 [Sulfobacillus thermosulfidooxidans]OLZ20698.1 hypothetical protein BFX07_14540 [Sulfobacillus thermosulfidooxidans]
MTKGVIVVKNSTWTFVPWTYTYHDHITTVWNAKLGTHYMLEDLSQGHAHYQIVPLWPGDLVTSVKIPKANAVIFDDQGAIVHPNCSAWRKARGGDSIPRCLPTASYCQNRVVYPNTGASLSVIQATTHAPF